MLAERPWSALPPGSRDALRPGLPALADEIIAAIAEAVPEYDRPLRGELRPRHPHRRRAGAARSSSTCSARPTPAPRGGVYRALGRGEQREGRSPRRAAGRLPARRARRLAALRRGRRGARASAPTTSGALAEAIFAYIDELAAESVEGYAAAQARVAGEAERRRRRLRRAARARARRPAAVATAAADAGWPLPRLLAVVAADASERVAARLGPGAIAADDVLVVADPERARLAPARASWKAFPPASARASSPATPRSPTAWRLPPGGWPTAARSPPTNASPTS